MNTDNLKLAGRALYGLDTRKAAFFIKKHKKYLEKYVFNEKTRQNKDSGNRYLQTISVNFYLTPAPKKMKLHSQSDISDA